MATTIATGTTDATGTLASVAVPSGVPITVSDSPPAGFTAATPQTVTVQPGQTQTVTLQVQAAQASITVKSVDQFGRPVAGDKITVSG